MAGVFSGSSCCVNNEGKFLFSHTVNFGYVCSVVCDRSVRNRQAGGSSESAQPSQPQTGTKLWMDFTAQFNNILMLNVYFSYIFNQICIY